jgi:flagella basal body P-ring formation protein FlgA
MKVIFGVFFMILSLPVTAINSTYRGHTPLMLSDLLVAMPSELTDRVLVSEKHKGWVKLASLLTPNELATLPDADKKKVWLDLCQPANTKTVKANVYAWLKQQDWFGVIDLKELKVNSKLGHICKEWDNIVDFYSNRAVVSVNSIELSTKGIRNKIIVQLVGNYSVPVAQSDITAGASLKRADWLYEKKRLTDTKIDELNWFKNKNWQSRVTIKKNNVIKKQMLSVSLAVNYGETVKVHLLNSLIEINTIARAIGKGHLGDSVMVLIDGSSVPVKSKIIAKGVVKIEV